MITIYVVPEVVLVLPEVVQLLRKRGVDLDHNRFLILQGIGATARGVEGGLRWVCKAVG